MATAHAMGLPGLLGQCFESLGSTPLAPWIDLIAGVDREPDPAEAREIERTLRGLLQRPSVLALEDLHWADRASVDLLAQIARGIDDFPVLLIGTYRDVELGEQSALAIRLPEIVREYRPLRVMPKKLDREAIADLMDDRYPEGANALRRVVDLLDRYADGIPLFIEELLLTLEFHGVLSSGDAEAPGGALELPAVPPVVQQIVANHIATLSDATVMQLQAASVFDGVIPLELWLSLLDLSEDSFAAAVDEALAARLIVELPDLNGYGFRHSLIRESFYRRLSLPRRTLLHRRVGELLSQGMAPAGVIAEQFRSASDPRAGEWLLRAGRVALAADAAPDAIALFEKALGSPGVAVEDSIHGWLLRELAESHRFHAPMDGLLAAGKALAIAERCGDRALLVATRWTMARLHAVMGEPVLEAIQSAFDAWELLPKEARGDLGDSVPSNVPSRGDLIQWKMLYGRYRDAAEAATSLLEQAVAEPSALSPRERIAVLMALGISSTFLGHPPRARAALRAARDVARATGNAFARAWVLKYELQDLALTYSTDDLDERQRLVEEYRIAFEESGGFFARQTKDARQNLLRVLYLEGEWDLAVAATSRDPTAVLWRPEVDLALERIDLARGRYASAWDRLTPYLAAGSLGTPDGNLYFGVMLAHRRLAAELSLVEGDLDRAREWLDAHERWVEWCQHLPERALGETLRGAYFRALDDVDAASAHAKRAVELASSPRMPLALAGALRLSGVVATESGDEMEARRFLFDAFEIAEAARAKYEQALTQLAIARMEIRFGDQERAAKQIDQVEAICKSLGARPILGQIETMRAEVTSHVENLNVRAGAGLLTDRESQVLTLLAQGLGDSEIGRRLFISPRTVARHLQAIYGKLDVHSRTAAIARASELGLLSR